VTPPAAGLTMGARAAAAVLPCACLLVLGGCNGASGAAAPKGAVVPASAKGWFEDRTQTMGIHYRWGVHKPAPLVVLDQMGGGCAIVDYDVDDWPDLFLVGQPNVGDTGRSALYHNNRDGTFTDVTTGSGLETPGFYMGCAAGDVDNDGKPDLLVTGYGVVRLFRNLGAGKFQDVTAASGLTAPSRESWATSAGFADVDRDSRLDLYVGRYVIFNSKTRQLCDYGGVKASCGPRFYDPQFGSLYRNLGGFKFADRTKPWGLGDQNGKTLGVIWGDVNDDGWPDLYLGNDEMPGDLYVNQKGKGFLNEALPANVALAADGTAQGAMGVDLADCNRDGRPDLFVSTFQGEPDSFYLSAGGGIFENATVPWGLDAPTRFKVGWGAKFLDVDNDGYPDLGLTNGHVYDTAEKVDRMSTYPQPLQLFMNDRGRGWVDRTADAGPAFTAPAVGRGLASGDLNNDGLTDLVVADLQGPVRVLINQAPQRGKWLRVALRGTKSNRMGLGAKVKVRAGDRLWTAESTTSGSYLSSSDPRVAFGLGETESIDQVEVLWPSGARSVVKAPRVPGEIVVEEK
jgi:hypothetical protein